MTSLGVASLSQSGEIAALQCNVAKILQQDTYLIYTLNVVVTVACKSSGIKLVVKWL